MKTSANGLNLIKDFEGFQPRIYLCPAGKVTIGYGHVVLVGEKFSTITKEQASILLAKDVRFAEKTIANVVMCDLTQNEFDALVSFIYNIGGTAFRKSTMLKYLNNEAYLDAADELLKWCHIGKEVSQGLLRRRKAERALFLKE
jgi:lysozyme